MIGGDTRAGIRRTPTSSPNSNEIQFQLKALGARRLEFELELRPPVGFGTRSKSRLTAHARAPIFPPHQSEGDIDERRRHRRRDAEVRRPGPRPVGPRRGDDARHGGAPRGGPALPPRRPRTRPLAPHDGGGAPHPRGDRRAARGGDARRRPPERRGGGPLRERPRPRRPDPPVRPDRPPDRDPRAGLHGRAPADGGRPRPRDQGDDQPPPRLPRERRRAAHDAEDLEVPSHGDGGRGDGGAQGGRGADRGRGELLRRRRREARRRRAAAGGGARGGGGAGRGDDDARPARRLGGDRARRRGRCSGTSRGSWRRWWRCRSSCRC